MKFCVIYLAVAIGLSLGMTQSLLAQQTSKAPNLQAIEPAARFGVCTHMRRTDHGWNVEKLIPIIKQMGISTIRDNISWGRTEKVKGQYALAPEDEAWLKAILDADIKVILMLGYGNSRYENPTDPAGYAAFTAWLANHFKGNENILAFELWNEPNNFHVRKQYGGSWNGKDNAPWLKAFAQIVSQSASAIKQADPNRTVITSAGNAAASMHMLERFPDAFTYVEGLTLHPYSFRLPPETVPWGGDGITKRDGIRTAGDDHSMVSLWQTLEDKMIEKLGKKLGIWVTEVGFTSFNHSLKAGIYAGYTEPVQAAYLTRSTIAGIAWPNIKTWCVYDLMNDGTNPGVNEDNFGIIRHARQGLAPKPAFFALRRMAQFLGKDHQFITKPPLKIISKSLELDQNDVWKKRPVDSYITDTSEKVYWFKTAKGYVTFVWRAGRVNGEHNPPLGHFPTVVVPDDAKITITDLVTGQSLDHLAQQVGHDVTIKNLPIQGYPIAIQWQTAGQLKPLIAPQPGEQIKIPLSHARGQWKFTNGPEFKGATGTITVPQKDTPLKLSYDFTRGGNYVAAIKYLTPALHIKSLSLKITGDKTPISLRIKDQTGQIFQYKFSNYKAGEPLTLDLLKTKAPTSWGGAKDRKIHFPISNLWIMATRKGGKTQGEIQITDIQATMADEPTQ